jgi:hypothetical protein
MNKAIWVLLLVLLVGCGKNGKNGIDGKAGNNAVTSTYSISHVVDPCGDAPNIVDEVLLVLYNKQVLVSFSQNQSGLNTRLALLPAGTYTTTDGSNCTFTLDNQGNIY